MPRRTASSNTDDQERRRSSQSRSSHSHSLEPDSTNEASQLTPAATVSSVARLPFGEQTNNESKGKRGKKRRVSQEHVGAASRSSKKGRTTSLSSEETLDEASNSLESPVSDAKIASTAITPGQKDIESSSTTSTVLTHEREPLPEGVVDIYPTKATLSCSCHDNHCSSRSLTNSYLSCYGYDYYQMLKDTEDTLSSSDSDESSFESSSKSSSSSTSLSTVASTPIGHGAVALAYYGASSSPLDNDTLCIDSQPHLTHRMRAVLVDWMIELAEEYKLNPLTLQLAVALVDASLACGAPPGQNPLDYLSIPRDMLQCLGCACMWIAAKMEETLPPCAHDFVYISDNSYTKDQITDMELHVCSSLKFRLWQTTPYHFMELFLKASAACPSCSATALFRNMVLYMMELSLLPYELVQVAPSLKAAAAVYLARVNLGVKTGGGLWSKTLEYVTGYSALDLEETAQKIHDYHVAAEDSSNRSVFLKFRTEKYMNVSLKTVPLDVGF